MFQNYCANTCVVLLEQMARKLIDMVFKLQTRSVHRLRLSINVRYVSWRLVAGYDLSGYLLRKRING
jgi:predicted ATP-grasp superfamily ATP-dependent carboligase